MITTVEKNAKFETLENSHYGSEQFYRHPFRHSLIMTEGCKDFINTFECFWLFDELARVIDSILTENKESDDLFNVVTVKALKGKVDIEIKHDTDSPVFYKRHIAHSDLQDGLYETWCIGTPIFDEETEELKGVRYTWLLKSEY